MLLPHISDSPLLPGTLDECTSASPWVSHDHVTWFGQCGVNECVVLHTDYLGNPGRERTVRRKLPEC